MLPGAQMEGEGTRTPGTGSVSTPGGQVSVCVTWVNFKPRRLDSARRRNQ